MELLLLLCILAILLALVIPAVHNVREQSRIAYCLGNLRQIGLALDAYLGDSDGFFPPADVEIRSDDTEASRVEPEKKAWWELLCPYLNTPPLQEWDLSQKGLAGTCFDCPSNPASTEALGFDYAYNSEAILYLGGRSQNIVSPAFQIVISEGNWYLNSRPGNVVLVHSLVLGSPGANYLFADGHAEWSGRYHLMVPGHSPWRPYLRRIDLESPE